MTAPRHVKTLDSMRAISALVVFTSHLVQIFWLPLVGLKSTLHTANNILSESAVIVFFLLSGYLITMSIWKNIGVSGQFRVTEYAAARVARIYPPLLCAILVAAGVYFLVNAAGLPGGSTPLRHASDLYAARDFLTISPAEVASALQMRGGLLQINGPLWSLYIEVQLYAAAGAAALALKGRTPFERVVGTAAFAALAYFLMRHNYLLYTAWWLLGAAFFLGQMTTNSRYLSSLVCAALSAAILYFTTASMTVETLRLGFMLGLAYLMFYAWEWKSPQLETIADFSYTLYLLHFPLIVLGYSAFLALQSAAPPTLEARIFASLVTALIAFVTAKVLGQFAENTQLFKRMILSTLQFGLRRLRVG